MGRFVTLIGLRSTVLLGVVLVVLGACGDDGGTGDGISGEPDDGDTRRSIAGDWVLETLTIDRVAITPPPGDIEMTIAAGEMSGSLGCNSFSAVIAAADDGSVTISGLGQTEMACLEEGRMEFEAAYGRALGSVDTWAVEPAGLTLRGDAVEITYSQAPPPVHRPLEGTVWTFATIYEGSGPERAATHRGDMDGVTLVIESGVATLDAPSCTSPLGLDVVHDDGRQGAFVVSGEGDDGVVTECGADDEIVDLALRGLRASSGFEIDESRLTFIGEAGETVGFSAPDP